MVLEDRMDLLAMAGVVEWAREGTLPRMFEVGRALKG
jgi:hypothetical protein